MVATSNSINGTKKHWRHFFIELCGTSSDQRDIRPFPRLLSSNTNCVHNAKPLKSLPDRPDCSNMLTSERWQRSKKGFRARPLRRGR